MSTKIRNASYYDGQIENLIADLEKFRDKIIEYRILKFIKEFNSLISSDDLPISWVGIQEAFIKMIQGIERESDEPPSCVVYFNKNKIYTQLFGLERDEMEMLYEISDNFYYFEYFDNCDLDDELIERGKVWNEIFKKTGIPEEAGFTFPFFPRRMLVSKLIEINNSYKK